jgi:hypothetical protein
MAGFKVKKGKNDHTPPIVGIGMLISGKFVFA